MKRRTFLQLFGGTAVAAPLAKNLQFDIVKEDLTRPWGGFYVIDEAQASQFAQQFFPEEDFESLKISEKLSPKILMVAPGKRLSWQYHHRRAAHFYSHRMWSPRIDLQHIIAASHLRMV